MAGENMLIEDDEDQKGSKSQEVEFVPVETKEPKGSDRDEDHDDEGDADVEDVVALSTVALSSIEPDWCAEILE